MKFGTDILRIDPAAQTVRLVEFLQEQVNSVYRRSGIVVGLSGGIDSAVMSELAVRAVGKGAVKGLILPEKESNPISSSYAKAHAAEAWHRLEGDRYHPHCRQRDALCLKRRVHPFPGP